MTFVKTVWNDPDDDALRALWGSGLPTAKIGEIMGKTKNAIIGRAHRLKLPPRPNAIKPKPPIKRVARKKVAFKEPEKKKVLPAPPVQEPPPPKPVERIGPPSDRTAGAPTGCQWPMKQKGYYVTFCGKERFNDKPYCEEHTRRAYGPPKPVKGQSL